MPQHKSSANQVSIKGDLDDQSAAQALQSITSNPKSTVHPGIRDASWDLSGSWGFRSVVIIMARCYSSQGLNRPNQWATPLF